MGEVGLRRLAVEDDDRERAVLLDPRHRGAAAPVGRATEAAWISSPGWLIQICACGSAPMRAWTSVSW